MKFSQSQQLMPMLSLYIQDAVQKVESQDCTRPKDGCSVLRADLRSPLSGQCSRVDNRGMKHDPQNQSVNPTEKERVRAEGRQKRSSPSEKKTHRRATPSRRVSVQKEKHVIIGIRQGAPIIRKEVSVRVQAY